jgi:uncharacterized protein YbjT (DUF2867 family)
MSEVSTVLVIGASGSIGRPVVDELTRRGANVRVLVRESSRDGFPEGTDVLVGAITDPDDVAEALDGVDAVVLTHGASAGGGRGTAENMEAVDYGAVKNVLTSAPEGLHIALMTAICVTYPEIGYNQTSRVCDWKRRSERLVRSSGLPYTIVRPGWFDVVADGENAVVLEQGDQRHSGTADDGGVARQQIAEVLVDSLYTDSAAYRTLELFAAPGDATTDLDQAFAALDADLPGALDGVHDRDSQPLTEEPSRVLTDLDSVHGTRA